MSFETVDCEITANLLDIIQRSLTRVRAYNDIVPLSRTAYQKLQEASGALAFASGCAKVCVILGPANVPTPAPERHPSDYDLPSHEGDFSP